MRVLVTGATGVVGRQLVPLLLDRGHEVVCIARSEQRLREVSQGRAEAVAVDALDRDAFVRAVRTARADVAVQLATQIPHAPNPRRFHKQMAATDRLRSEGTHNLLEGCRAAGTVRVVAEGLAFAYRPTGAFCKGEDEPLWTDGPRQFAPVARALAAMEAAVAQEGGTVLRYGHLYGPGTAYAQDGDTAARVRRRALPIIGDGGAVFSFLHARDAAEATLTAVEAETAGVFNIVDDDPAPAHEWLTHYAAKLGAPPPRRVPSFLARPLVGEWGVAFLTRIRGASNTRAKASLDWRPTLPSWREELAQGPRGMTIPSA